MCARNAGALVQVMLSPFTRPSIFASAFGPSLRHAFDNCFFDDLQGGVTPIGPVLTTATAVKMWSRGHGTSEAPVKRSSSKLVPTTVKINPHLLFCIKLQSVTRPDPDLAIRSTEEHNCHDICLHAQQLSYLASAPLAIVMGGAYGTTLMRFMTFVSS